VETPPPAGDVELDGALLCYGWRGVRWYGWVRKNTSGCAHLGENARESEWDQKERINKRWAHVRMNLVVGGVRRAKRRGKKRDESAYRRSDSTRLGLGLETHRDAREPSAAL
jgi:hypothetical protein